MEATIIAKYKDQELNELVDLDGLTSLNEIREQFTFENEDGDDVDTDEIEITEIKSDTIPAKYCDPGEIEEYLKAVEQHSEDIVNAAAALDIPPDDIDEAYQGEYGDDEAFAQEMAFSIGAIDKNATWPNNCIDWEYAAKELMYDYAEHDGHYFRNL